MPFGLGASSQLGIGIAIELQDRFSGKAVAVNKALVDLRKNSQSALTSALRDYRNQSLAVVAGAAALGKVMLNLSQSGSEFQHAINQVYIVGGRELGKSRAQLSQFATDLSRVFSRDPLEIAAGMFENAKAGLSRGMEMITKYQIAVATATDEAIGGPNGVAANLLNIMNAMDIPREKFADIANTVTAVANATQASVNSLGEAMRYGAFTAKQFNLPLATTVSLFGKMAQVGIPGSRAGTALDNMLTHMAKSLGSFATKDKLKAWRALGLNPDVMAGMVNSGDITGVIKVVSDAVKGMPIAEKGTILPKIFNMRGTKGLLGLFDSEHGNKSIGDIIAEAEEGMRTDISMRQSGAMMNDLYSDFKFFTNSLKRFGIQFTESVGPMLRKLLQGASSLVDFFGNIVSTPIGSVLASLTAVITPLVGILFAFRAAAATAVLSLGVMAKAGSVGGFGSLMRATLGGMGLGAVSSAATSMGGGLAINKAGRAFIPAGNPMGILNPKTGLPFRPGALVPKSVVQNFLGAGTGVAAGASIGATGRGVGALGGMLSGVLGFAAKAVGVLGAILLAVEVLKMLGVVGNKREERTDEGVAQYYRSLDRNYFGVRDKSNSYYLHGGKPFYGSESQFKQSLIINVDGRRVVQESVNAGIDNTALKILNIKN